MNSSSPRSSFFPVPLAAALMLAAGHFAASAGVINISGLAWTTATTSGNSLLVSDGGAPGQGNVTSGATLVLVGPDLGSVAAPNRTEVTASTTFAVAGVLSFSYQGTSLDTSWADLTSGDPLDSGRYDKVGYRVDSFATILSPASLTSPPEIVTGGPIVLNVTAGQTVTFFANSYDEFGGAATLEISNLTFTPVPEPASLAVIAGAGLVGFAAWRRRSVSTR